MSRLVLCFGCVLPLATILAPTCGPKDPPNTTCNTAYMTSVGDCTDWITGPASPNSDATFANGQRLWTADQGWAVPGPDGTDLRLMVYGDSFWLNGTYRDCLLEGCESSPACDAFEALCPAVSTPEHQRNPGCNNTVIPADPGEARAICQAACNYTADPEALAERMDCFDRCDSGDRDPICEERCTYDPLLPPLEECMALCGIWDCSRLCSWDERCVGICTGAASAAPHDDWASLCRFWTEGAPGVQGLAADYVNHSCPKSTRRLLSNQVVFFEADVTDPLVNPYRIDLTDQVTDRKIRHNEAERDMQCADLSIGVYTGDYFYACPLSYEGTDCPDVDRKLFFLTGTTCWNCDATGRSEMGAMIDGVGIYYYDYPDDPGTAGALPRPEGFRVMFAYGDTVLRPPSPYPGITITNPNVLWGYGTEMQNARVFRDYRDPYGRSTERYVYFIGTSALSGDLHLARVEANALAILEGRFEYLLDVVDSPDPTLRDTIWGAYDPDGLHALVGVSAAPSSIIKKGSLYWMASLAATSSGTHYPNGMAVAYSSNGLRWTLAPSGEGYTDYANVDPLPGWVYGYTWIPPVVMERRNALPVAFSVWKSYEGYFDDYFRNYDDAERDPISEDRQFRDYNTKMYWFGYWWLRPFPILDYPYRPLPAPISKDGAASNGTMELPFDAWAMWDDGQNRHVVIEFCECGFNDDVETCRSTLCDPTIPMLAGQEVYSRGQMIPNPWKAPLLANGGILDRVKFAPGQQGSGVRYSPEWLWLDQLGSKTGSVLLRYSYWQDEGYAAEELRENLRSNPDTSCDPCYLGQLPCGDQACDPCWLEADTAFQTTDVVRLSY